MTKKIQIYKFTCMRPGGNDTALVSGIPSSQKLRSEINKRIMKKHRNIEQVGFVNLDKNSPELVMAGGEFCGNATRSTAWKFLDGKPGNIEIKVSGVENKLKAGITEAGHAFAQMPIFDNPKFIIPDEDNPGNYTVQMEGITHYIDFDTEKLKDLTNEEIKKLGMREIKKRKLDDGPAAGAIYVIEKKNQIHIVPIIYVKAINTEFLESGCGSGTTALGMVMALKARKSIKNVPIYQPSDLPITVSVKYENNKFVYAQISGPVEKLDSGTLEFNIN